MQHFLATLGILGSLELSVPLPWQWQANPLTLRWTHDLRSGQGLVREQLVHILQDRRFGGMIQLLIEYCHHDKHHLKYVTRLNSIKYMRLSREVSVS